MRSPAALGFPLLILLGSSSTPRSVSQYLMDLAPDAPAAARNSIPEPAPAPMPGAAERREETPAPAALPPSDSGESSHRPRATGVVGFR